MTALALAHHPIPKMSQVFSSVENKPRKELNCVRFAQGHSAVPRCEDASRARAWATWPAKHYQHFN